MPIYKIRCPLCGCENEVLMSYEEVCRTECERCGVLVDRVPCRTSFTIEGACAANGYDTASNIPDDHYDPRVGQSTWD